MRVAILTALTDEPQDILYSPHRNWEILCVLQQTRHVCTVCTLWGLIVALGVRMNSMRLLHSARPAAGGPEGRR